MKTDPYLKNGSAIEKVSQNFSNMQLSKQLLKKSKASQRSGVLDLADYKDLEFAEDNELNSMPTANYL